SISVIEDFTFESPKTKQYLEMLSALSLSNKKTLLILSSYDKNVYLSGRNIPKVNVSIADDVNTYDLINAEVLLISEGAVSKLENLLNN
ncbi:MAG: 50S ribosomal protein L4, partial [Runella slithyformis]